MSYTALDWKPTRVDLALSAGVALLFPVLAGLTYGRFGALVPMLVYYAAAWGISIWRRGWSGYHLKQLEAPPASFYIHLAVIAAVLVLAFLARVEVQNPVVLEVVITASVWSVLNASSEQLLWIYIFDSWDLFGRRRFGRRGRFLMSLTGVLLFTVFIAVIHMFYWARFLHTVDPASLPGMLFIVGTTLSGYLHIVVWRQSSQMLYTFIPHLLLNFPQVVWTGYSLMPYILRAGSG